jgi:hypothetical protein
MVTSEDGDTCKKLCPAPIWARSADGVTVKFTAAVPATDGSSVL